MGQVARLADIITRLSEFDIDDTIYAREPWTGSLDAMVVTEPEPDEEHEYDGQPAPEAIEAGLTYFLEISLARELVRELIANASDEPSASAICERVIQYAINDA